MTRHSHPHPQRGFTLLEVMIALLVVSLGLLGLAKMQAVAISNTQISSVRSLLSFQAGSLAASMRANRAFWAAGGSTFKVETSAGIASSDNSDLKLHTHPGDFNENACAKDGVCAPAELAAYDIEGWANELNKRFPTAESKVECQLADSSTPAGCTIAINWQEKYVAMNAATAAPDAAKTSKQTLTLHVMP